MVKEKEKVEGIELPTKKIKAETQNPKDLVLCGKPKTGKTEAVSHLEDCLLIDLEQGSKSIDAMKVEANSITDLRKICTAIYKSDKKYKYIAVDTLTKLEEWAEDEATELYMKTSVGKKFNRDEMGNILPRKNWDSVLTLPNGGGYFYLRQVMKNWLSIFDKLSEHIIFITHVKDKFVNEEGKEVNIMTMDLTGKIAGIVAQKCDAIGFIYIDKKTGDQIITFDSKSVEGGTRQKHIAGKKFKLVEKDENNKVTKVNWDKIYINK